MDNVQKHSSCINVPSSQILSLIKNGGYNRTCLLNIYDYNASPARSLEGKHNVIVCAQCDRHG
jgi:hypothetical protein